MKAEFVNHIWSLPYLSLPYFWSLPYLKPTVSEAYHIWSLPDLMLTIFGPSQFKGNSIWDTPRFCFNFFHNVHVHKNYLVDLDLFFLNTWDSFSIFYQMGGIDERHSQKDPLPSVQSSLLLIIHSLWILKIKTKG